MIIETYHEYGDAAAQRREIERRHIINQKEKQKKNDDTKGGFSGNGRMTEKRFQEHEALAKKLSRKWL